MRRVALNFYIIELRLIVRYNDAVFSKLLFQTLNAHEKISERLFYLVSSLYAKVPPFLECIHLQDIETLFAWPRMWVTSYPGVFQSHSSTFH